MSLLVRHTALALALLGALAASGGAADTPPAPPATSALASAAAIDRGNAPVVPPAAPADPAVERPGPVSAGAPNPMTLVDLRVTIGKSLVIDYPADIARISTSDPKIVDAVPATSREFLIHGKSHGVATVVVWAKSGLRTMYNLTVEHNVEPIRRLLRETFPNETIQVQAAGDEVTLTGRVATKDVSDRAALVAAPLAKSVVNHLQVAAPPISRQIILRVKFAELNRNATNSFGVNLVPLGAGGNIGRVTTGQFGPPNVQIENGQTRVSIADALNIFAFRPDLNLMAFVRALQGQGVLQILAEPNLVTTPGKDASFLVGGEFPVPVIQGGANAGAITITFREFGVRLTFNPQLTEHGTIKLYVKPEVNTLDLANAVTISGFTIPALATRRVETNIELSEGQSFVIGGLIDDRVTETVSRIPALASIPILGQMFRSRQENRSKTELVVIVTPELAAPLAPGEKPPIPQYPKEFLPAVVPLSGFQNSKASGGAGATTAAAAGPGSAPAAAGKVAASGTNAARGLRNPFRRPAPAPAARPAEVRLARGVDSGLSAVPQATKRRP